MTAHSTILASYPGFIIAQYPEHHQFSDGAQIAIPFQTRNHGTLYRFYTLGDVRSYAEKYGEDADAAEERARKNGHELFYAFQNATVISAGKQERRLYPQFNHGDVIRYAGRKFRIDPTFNGNIKLTQV